MGGGAIITRVLEDVLPCMSMLLVEACTIFLTIAASTAMARGMSPFVFVVYSNALASIILLPYSFMSDRNKVQRPLFTSHLLWRVFLLGLIGVAIAQNLAFVGLFYSSPIVAISMANIVPALSFMLSAMLRSGKFDWKSVGSLAKVIGSLVSMLGAISVTFYKGPLMRQYASSFALSSLRQNPYRLVFTSQHDNWVIGCLFFAGGALSLSVWNMVQVGTIKKYPQVFRILSLYSLVGTVLTAVFAVIVERDLNAWKLELNFELAVIVLTAIFQSLIRSNIQIWCTRKKGPQFVAAFKPFGVIVASICGCTIFADTFHYGSMLSAFICGLGYYTLMWGNIRDGEPPKQAVGNNGGSGGSDSGSRDNLAEEKVPLLEGEEIV